MIKSLLSILFCLISITCIAQKRKNTTDNRFAGLDTAFARVLKDWKAAGFAVAVVEKNKVVYAKGFGYKDWENKIPATENTQFAIGSCTKAFTASIFGVLAKEDKVDIDKPVRNYLPALRFFNDNMNDNVTLRDMISHRTGVSRYDYSWYLFPSASRDSLMHRVQYMEPSEPLRRKWQYNNFMYLLQGVVAEKITGLSWEENIQKKILQPLGMNNTSVSLAEWKKAGDLAIGYGLKNDTLIKKLDYYDISAMAPAGSINSSVLDMAKWVTLWINGGKYEGKEILPPSYVLDAISSQMVISGNLPTKESPDVYLSNYGLGWMLSSYRGHYRVEHGGNIDGFSASTCFYPSDSIGIIVLSNQDFSYVPVIVRNLISDRMLNLPYKDWQTMTFRLDTSAKAKAKEAMKTTSTTRKTGTITSHPLSDYTGTYASKGKESFEVVLKNDSLFMHLPTQRMYLRHYHYDVFNIWDKDELKDNDTSNINGFKLMFLMDENGKINAASIPLEQKAKPFVFTKEIKGQLLSKDSLQKYVGDYSLNGTIVKVYIKGENVLYVFVPGQPEYELVAGVKDQFILKALPDYKVQFNGNAKGEISDLLFIQPNGTFKATRVVKL